MREVGRLITAEMPHFVALQEVTPSLLALLKKQRWYSMFHTSPEPADKSVSYFTMLLCKNLPVDIRRIPFQNSVMGRDIIIASAPVEAGGVMHRVTIATSHLESTWQFKAIRLKQLTAAFGLLSEAKQGSPTAVYVGDMNLKAGEGKELYSGEWKDTWTVAGKSEKEGNTFDTKKNGMIVAQNNAKGQGTKRAFGARFDRVFYRSTVFRPSDIRMIGTEPVPEDDDVFPSDHFGLVATFKLGN